MTQAVLSKNPKLTYIKDKDTYMGFRVTRYGPTRTRDASRFVR